MRSRVDYRFLRAVTNPVTGDEVTIGVLHWDGQDLRFAHALRAVPQELKGEVRRVLNLVDERVTQMPRGQSNLLKQDLAQLFPVPEGRGSVVHWGKPTSGLASSGPAHFAQLVDAAGLQVTPREDHISKNTLHHWMHDVAIRLHELAPERVQLNSRSPGHIPFPSPIAWKNGVWNFALPWSFDSNKSLEDQVRSLVGQLTTGLDQNSHAAVVFFAPAETRAKVLQELSYVESVVTGTRRSELSLRDGQLDTTEFESMVRSDVIGIPLTH